MEEKPFKELKSGQAPRAPQEMPQSAQLMMQLSILSQLFSTRMNKRLAAQGFTLAQLSILSHIATSSMQAGPQTISQIAEAVEVLQPAVTKTVSRFEKEGWVQVFPHPKDARVRQVAITQQGGQKLGALMMEMSPDAKAWNDQWSSQELEQKLAQIRSLTKWLDENRLE